MTPRQLKVAFVSFPYGGNGGISSEHPALRHWYAETLAKAFSDPRIGRKNVISFDICDTPITMTRNQAVEKAREAKADVLLMFDSDMGPDAHWEGCHPAYQHHHLNPLAKPFWETAFDFIYQNWEKGPRCIAAPYCGPPPIENVYVFEWKTYESDDPSDTLRLDMYSREHSRLMTGIQEAAALPTGLFMADMRLYDLMERPYHFYEYEGDGPPCPHCGVRKPGMQAKKCSTEDVVVTRDLMLHCQTLLGYNPLFCAWDSWAVHYKSKPVGMPTAITADQVAQKYKDAVARGVNHTDRIVEVGPNRLSAPEDVIVLDLPHATNGHAPANA
jgi:hypothetical protein